MASLTRLNRRLHQWSRYSSRYPDWNVRLPEAHYRAWAAVERERARRGLPAARRERRSW